MGTFDHLTGGLGGVHGRTFDHLSGGIAGAAGKKAAVLDQVVTAQDRLAVHGFDPGVRHGQMDHPTRLAVRKFQGAIGLPVTGVVDGPTHTALHQEPSTTRGTRTGRPRGGLPGTGRGGPSPMPPIQHSTPHAAPPAGAPHHAATGARMALATQSQGARSMNRTHGLASTGFRAPLLFSQSIVNSSGNAVVAKPQMDFRGENLVIDSTVVGPLVTVSMPTVGSIPQIIGGGASTTVPGTMFSPNQCGALDFEMAIAQQGNDITILVSTTTTVTFVFACALFGHEVMPDGSPAAAAAGVMPPSAYRR
jgi:peptidoglycan hydrolase-like protein with peptidoglycan-binding domain